MRFPRIVLCAALAVSAAACASSEAAGPETVVSNYKFPAITTTPGAKLTFVNRDIEPHTVTADDGAFDTGPFNSNTRMEFIAPSTEGSFAFFCEFHPNMQGTLVVTNS